MADETHMPDWGEIATGFGEYAEWLCRDEDSDAGYGHDYRDGSGYLAAHRWLAAHDATVKAEAWDAAVRAIRYEDGTPVEIVSVVNPYRIREGGE